MRFLFAVTLWGQSVNGAFTMLASFPALRFGFRALTRAFASGSGRHMGEVRSIDGG